MLAHLELALGKKTAAFERLDQAAHHEPAWALEVRALLAALPFTDLPEAERMAIERELDAWNPLETRASVAIPLAFHDGLHPHLRLFLLGALAGRRGDRAAVRLAADAFSELPVPSGAEALAEQLARTLDALGLRLDGRPDNALAALEGCRTDVWFQYAVGSPFFAGPYQRFLRAELLEAVGRTDEAIRWWRTVAQRSPYELVFAGAAAERITRAGRRADHPRRQSP